MINLLTLSEDYPLYIPEEEYHQLIQKKKGGWSNCESRIEWLAKLYYLRRGMKEGKIDAQKFIEQEKELVLRWWKKWC